MIKTCCPSGRLVVAEDSCLRMQWKCSYCKRIISQRKRRPRGVDVATCTWSVECSAHPEETQVS